VTVAWAVLGAFALGGGWYLHVLIFPWKDCPRCGGSKRNGSGNAFRRCGRCDSTGEVRRWGAPKVDR
jgi:hypothetical protein